MARVPVSKTGGWGFESLLPCGDRHVRDGVLCTLDNKVLCTLDDKVLCTMDDKEVTTR